MRVLQRFHAIIAGILVFLSAGTAAAQEAPAGAPDALRKTIDKAIERMKPSLVRIHVVWTEYDGGREVKYESFGSGAIISGNGHVITNHHVAGRSKQIFCTLSSREEVEAELLGTDPLTDISVLALQPEKPRKFPAAAFGDSSKVRVGDTVLAMGSPLALSQSVTLGIVSNTEMIQPRIFGPFKFRLEGEDVGSVVRWLGHDAAIYGGNSGGPLVNLKGEIIGINEIDIGLSGAIPGNLAKAVAEKITRHGKVARAWIGIEVQPLLKRQKMKGILVSGTIEGSPAEKAGFGSGDVLVRLAGKDVNAKFDEEVPLFNLFVMGMEVGKPAEAAVIREGKEIRLKVTPIDREEMRPRPQELQAWGVTARNMSYVLAKELKRKDSDGVLVTSVRPGGPCAEAKPRITAKDVITGVDGKPVKNLEAVAEATRKLLDGKKDVQVPVLVSYERDQEKLLTVVTIGNKASEESGTEVKKAWLPLMFQVLTQDLAAKLGVEGKKGVRITRVLPVKTAIDAGFKVGDLVMSLNGDEIPSSLPEEHDILPAMVRQYRIGTKAAFGVVRDGKEIKVEMTLPGAPRQPREMKKLRDESFEFDCRGITFMDRVAELWSDDQTGVVVDEVTPGGWAALGTLSVGDLVLSIDGKETPNVEALKGTMAGIEKERPSVVVFHVRRGIHHLFLELKPGWPKKK
ncbi:MAG: PDZ domain-containing protein [Deltaproteobacteria bacterium]|nr:PDZ domain-containing protein [Deltaproteobacteria bacterium]